MGRRAWIVVAILLLTVDSACTGSHPAVRASESPSPTAATVSPAPVPLAVACSAIPTAESEPLVLSWSLNDDQISVASLHDPSHPATLCTMGKTTTSTFISRTEVGFALSLSPNDPSSGTSVIGRINLTDGKPVSEVAVQGMVMDLVWSPDGANLAYLLYVNAPGLGSGSANQLWLKTGDAPARPLTPLIPLFGRGGSISDQTVVRFSHDGKYLLMVDTYVDGPVPASADQAHFQVRAMPSGNLVWVPASALSRGANVGPSFVTMAAWSRTSDRLYYRDSEGVHSWDAPISVAPMAAGLAWYTPSISPDGRFVAYTVNYDTKPQVEVRDLASNTVRALPGMRAKPLFVSGSKLVEGTFEPNHQQGPGTPYPVQTGSVVFDLNTGVETRLPVAINPIDSWPH
jgi:hypothetical protein